MRVLTARADGALVLPFAARAGAPFHFATLHAHAHRGLRAVVAEVPESPRQLAVRELGLDEPSDDDAELVGHTAAWLLGELAWLQDAPEGVEVRLGARSGRMACLPTLDHLDWWKGTVKPWARKQRREGYLPVLIAQGARVRTLSLPWAGAVAVVSLDQVRARLPDFGVRGDVDHLEVL